MRIMAIDVGSKRIGLALTDPLGMLALPAGVVYRKSDSEAVQEICRLLKEKDVSELVVGLPRRTDGTEGPEAEKVRQFAQKVQDSWPGKISWYDERLTTVSAQHALLEADVSRAKRKKVVDQVAASLILQGYLEYMKSGRGKTTHITSEE